MPTDSSASADESIHHHDPMLCMRLNERRQARVMSVLAEESAAIGTGSMSFHAGTHWMCKAVGVDLDEALCPDTLARICDWYAARGSVPVVETTSLAPFASFEALHAAGFGLVEVENVLACFPAKRRRELPEGYAIEALDRHDAAAMREHAEIVCSAFPGPDGVVTEELIQGAIRSHLHPDSLGFFVLDPRGKRVAASGMEVSDIEATSAEAPRRLASLWGTVVLPAHRRRGIQQALIAHRLGVGAGRGASVALIESRPGIPTERNAARVGFALRYVRLVFKPS